VKATILHQVFSKNRNHPVQCALLWITSTK